MNARVLKIAIVTKRLDRGGAETHLLRVVPELRARGIDVSMVVPERGGRLEADFLARGISIEGPEKTGGRALHVAKSAVQLARHLRRNRFDAVHYFLPEPYLIGCMVSPFAGAPMRIMSRRSLSDYQRRHPALGALERRLHAGTALLLGNSKAVADQLVAETGTPGKVGLIHNGIALDQGKTGVPAEQVRRALGLAGDAFVITIVANLIDYKGHADLLEALAIARPKLPAAWRLLVIGRDDGIGAQLKEQARSLGLGDRILWLGERTDAAGLLGIADLGVVASHEEGFSNSLIEAMGLGVPIVATAVGGNLDAIADRESGLLVPVRDPRAMAAAIAALTGDATLRHRLGAGARQRVQALFTLERCVSRYENLYRGLSRVGREPVQAIIDGDIDPAERAGSYAGHPSLDPG